MLFKVLPIILVSSLLILVGYALGTTKQGSKPLPYKNPTNTMRNNKITNKELTQKTTEQESITNYSRKVPKAKLSPNGQYIAYFEEITNEGSKSINFYVLEQTNDYFVKREGLFPIWKAPNAKQIQTIPQISWSKNGSYVAAVAGLDFVIFQIKSMGPSENYKEVVVTEIIKEGTLSQNLTGDVGLWFTQSSLQASQTDGVYEIWPEYKLILNKENKNGIYPAAEGYFYWEPKEECCKISLIKMSLNGTISDTGLIIDDYAGVVLPNQTDQWVCIENGASGYWGYVLYDLKQRTKVVGGQQYSYCGNWLDDNRITLIELPYFHQFSKQIYVYNLLTNKREPVINLENENY